MDDDALVFLLGQILGRIPGWRWDPETTSFSDEIVPIFYGRIDSEPDRAVGIRLYGTEDFLPEVLHERRVQLRFRGRAGDPRGANKLASPAFAMLQGLSRVGGISDIRRLSMSPLGADDNGREERTDNYLITLDNLEATS